jgi:hypothetical protein
VDNISAVVEYFGHNGIINGNELESYLRHNIDYPLDDRKRQGMDLFLELLART